MKKYYVTVSLEVEVDSPRQAALEVYGQLRDHRRTDAQVRVYNPPEVDDKGGMKITSTRWNYSASPQEVLPPKPAPKPETLGFKPAEPPTAPADALEAPAPELEAKPSPTLQEACEEIAELLTSNPWDRKETLA